MVNSGFKKQPLRTSVLPGSLQTSSPQKLGLQRSRMAQPLNPSQSGPQEPKTLSPHQEAMVEACKAGRLAELQTLFDEHSVKRGDDPVHYLQATQEGAPETNKLFASAISFGHQSIIRYLHSMYPKYDFSNGTIAHALLKRPDLQTLKLIYSYSPGFVHFECDDHITTLLSKACEGGPDNAPFIHFLLDRGAKSSWFGGYTWRLGGDLLPAIQHNQPMEIIKKMIPTTDNLSFPISEAVRGKRAEVLELLLNEELTRSQTSADLSFARSLLREGQTQGDKKVIAALERHIGKLERQATKSTKRNLQSTTSESSQAAKLNEAGEAGAIQENSSDMKSGDSKRWWQFRTHAKAKDEANAKDSGGPAMATGTGTPKWWWWPLSQIGNNPTSADRHDHKHKEEPDDSTSDEEYPKHS